MSRAIFAVVIAVASLSIVGCSSSADSVAGEYYIGGKKENIIILEKDGSIRFRSPLAGNFKVDGKVLKISLVDDRNITATIVSNDELAWGQGTPANPALKMIRVGSQAALEVDSDPSVSEMNQGSGPASASKKNEISPVEVKVVVRNSTVGTMYNGNTAVGPGLAVSWNELQIIARADHIEIRDITINRGNCTLPSKTKLPNELNFGQQVAISLYDCDILEVSVETDQGGWSTSFQ